MKLIREIKKTFPIMEKEMSETAKEDFANYEYGKLYDMHLTLGLWIRNNLLYNKPLHETFTEYGITHVDDMSALILSLYYAHLNKKKSDSQVNDYRP